MLALPAFRLLMVWLYEHTGSLLLSMLMHAAFSAGTLILQPQSTAGYLTWNAVLAGALWAIAAGLVVAMRGNVHHPRDT